MISFGLTCVSTISSSLTRKQLEYGRTGSDDRTWGVVIELHDDAANGGADIEPMEHILLGADLLHHIVALRFRLAQLFHRLLHRGGADLRDLLLRACDLFSPLQCVRPSLSPEGQEQGPKVGCGQLAAVALAKRV